MKVLVYAVTSRSTRRLAARGVLKEPLRIVTMGALSAIVGNVARTPAPTEPNLRRFATLIARLSGTHRALLPARFGTVVRTDDEVRIVLGARQRSLRQQLAHVRGRVQMTVRIVVTRRAAKGAIPTGRNATNGASYLRHRAEALRASSIAEFAPLGRAVARWVKDERVERNGQVVTVYHLVPSRFSSRYAAAIETAALESGARGFVTGPWPPYAFADTW